MDAQKAHLVKNAQVDGVTMTASGLQIRHLTVGTGKKPGPRSTVTVHYTGTLINGKQFDSSVGGEPISFGLHQVIPGWTEGLQLMAVGGKAELTIPADLAYGSRGAGSDIPGGATLIFQVELLAVR
jgi:FKBP-type peptidyl-prolyl cis-trans isomerase